MVAEKAMMLAKNLKARHAVAEMSSTKMIVLAGSRKGSHSPIHESVNIPCNVNRKYAVTTMSMPNLIGVKNFCGSIESTK